MKCPKCQAPITTAYHKWGGHGEDLYKCPSCATLLTHRYGLGAFFLAVLFVAPVLTILVELVLTSVLYPIIQDTRFADSNRFLGISLVASLVAMFFIFKTFNKLVVYEGEDNKSG